jgi:hypothetical protein
MKRLLLALLLVTGCHKATPPSWTEARVKNATRAKVEVYASFAPNSAVKGWDFCRSVPSGCAFELPAETARDLPTGGNLLSVNFSFGKAGDCAGTGTTLGEMTINTGEAKNDTADVSLVNGWNADVEVTISGAQTLGPTDGGASGAGLFGVYPNGCDICVARQPPLACPWQTPCGSPTDGGAPCGCQGGSQYAPSPPCQQTGIAKGSVVTVVLVSGPAGIPAVN